MHHRTERKKQKRRHQSTTYVTRTQYARAPTAQTKRLYHRTQKEKQLCSYNFLEEGKCCRENTVLLPGLSDDHSCFRVQVCIPHRFIHFQGRSRTQVILGSKEEGKEGHISQLKEITTKHAPHHTIRLAYPDTYNLQCLSCSPFFPFPVMSPVAALKPFRPVFQLDHTSYYFCDSDKGIRKYELLNYFCL